MIAGGGTGGHYFPALAVARKLRERGHEVLFVGSKRGIEGRLGFPAREKLLLDHSSFRGRGLKALLSLPVYGRAVFESFRFLKRLRPDVTLVFGGYSSLPVGLASYLLKIPLFIQEQNSFPGRTNRILSRFAVEAFVGFPGASKHLNCPSLFTGNPLRREVLEWAGRKEELRRRVIRELSLDERKKTLLVIGGSQGALWMNRLLVRAAEGLGKMGVQVIHVTGYGKDEGLREAYNRAGVRAVLFPFHPRPWELYASCDGAVSRAGALAISELSAFAIPSILIPYPFAADRHQYLNGEFVAGRGGALLYRQEELTLELFLQSVREILFDIMVRERMRKALSSIFPPDPTSLVVREIEEWKGRRS